MRLQTLNNLFQHQKVIFKYNKILQINQMFLIWTLMSRTLLYSNLYNSRRLQCSRNIMRCNNNWNYNSRCKINYIRTINIVSSSPQRHRRCCRSIWLQFRIQLVVVYNLTLVYKIRVRTVVNSYHNNLHYYNNSCNSNNQQLTLV